MYGRKRRGELADIQRNAAGEYVYTGNWYVYAGPENRRGRLIRLWLWYGLGSACALAAGLLPAPGAMNAFYVTLPYAAALVTAISALWSLGQLTAAGDPIRAFVHETALRRLPLRGMTAAVLAWIAIPGEAVYLLRHGAGDGGFAALFLALMGLSGGCMLLGRRTVSGMRWEKKG